MLCLFIHNNNNKRVKRARPPSSSSSSTFRLRVAISVCNGWEWGWRWGQENNEVLGLRESSRAVTNGVRATSVAALPAVPEAHLGDL